MVEVLVIAEGQTEEQFIKRVMAPALRALQIFIKPLLLPTSRNAKGGAVTFGRLQLHARNTLRSNSRCVLTTLLDLYALDTDFPAQSAAKKLTDVHQRCNMLEAALQKEIVAATGCMPERFMPHIQPFEFEGLLFSDVEALAQTEPGWHGYLEDLRHIRESFPSPEHINNSYETKPSKRLETLLSPTYKKTRHGPLAAEQVTLAVMERECPHFRTWLERIRALAT